MIQISGYFVRMLNILIFRSILKLIHVMSIATSLAKILGKPCVHSIFHSFVSNVMKFCDNINHHNM